MKYKCDFKFFSAPEGAIYTLEGEKKEKYREVCDGCGTKKQCNCFWDHDHDVIMDLCGSCQKEHLTEVEE